MKIQLPTGKVATVDAAWWYSLTDEEVKRFFEADCGSDVDPQQDNLLSTAVNVRQAEETQEE